MKTSSRIVIIGVILLAVIAVIIGRKSSSAAPSAPSPCCSLSAPVPLLEEARQKVVALPRLLDLGADKCVPCKMMVPILDELQKEYEGQLTVEFIDVWKNPDAGKQYGIEMIPTQIFYGADGKELYRHSGFFAKKDILKKWNELGVSLTVKKN